jgi:hypothetical protein
MILSIHSNARYLNKPNARSHTGGHHYLSENVIFPPNNGAIHNVAELGGLYINARKGVEIRNVLQELGHPQPPTPV